MSDLVRRIVEEEVSKIHQQLCDRIKDRLKAECPEAKYTFPYLGELLQGGGPSQIKGFYRIYPSLKLGTIDIKKD